MKKRIVRVHLKGQDRQPVVAATVIKEEGGYLRLLDDAGDLVAEFLRADVAGWSRETVPVGPQRYGMAKAMDRQEDEED
jgi:hypothetical protein